MTGYKNRTQAEESIRRQVEFNDLMTRALTRFSSCVASDVDESVTEALRELAEFVGADHAYVIVIAADRRSWTVTHEWCGPNVQPQFRNYQNVRLGSIPWSESRILSGRVVRVNTLGDYPSEAPERREADKQAGATSTLAVPIRGAAGLITGAVGMDSHLGDIAWSDDDVTRCGMMGNAIAGVLERKNVEQALRESELRFRIMADSAPVMMWMSNTEKACTDFNRGWLAFTGRTLTQELGDGWTESVYPADLETCHRTYVRAFDERQQFTMEYRLRRHDGVYRWITDTGVPRFLPDGSFAGYIGCCVDINDQRETEKARLELAGRLMTAQEAERTRISRELHDGIGQSIALLGLQMQHSAQRMSGDSERGHPGVEELCEKLQEIGNQVSRLSHQLHPSRLEFLGLAVTIKSLCRQFSEEYHIAVNCLCIDIPTNLKNEVSLCFLRVAQEALHNIAKHSHATRVQVLLVGTARRLTLIVRDDGVGFEANAVNNVRPSMGLGLISMRERLHLIGGDFTISSEPGQGTRIEVHAPLLAMGSISGTPLNQQQEKQIL